MLIPDVVQQRMALPLPRMTRERWEETWAQRDPAYRPEPLYRIRGEWRPNNGDLPRLLEQLHIDLARRYFMDVRTICEVGCGQGQNLVRLARMWPEHTYIGLDWSESALSRVAARLPQAQTALFDMFAPAHGLPTDTAVLTAGALEQLGASWQACLAWMLLQKPSVVVHVEPLYELYDDGPFDSVAKRWHDKRGYFKGYLPAIRDLAKQDRIEILECSRTPFGGMMHDGHSVLVWRPR